MISEKNKSEKISWSSDDKTIAKINETADNLSIDKYPDIFNI